jgi:cytochrome bd ubiquinol oxidase subunit II
MEYAVLANLWYFIIGFCIIAYTVLDGFDLGVGILHPFIKGDENRRIFLNAIGPVWDGNEVWLVVVVGALFAGFPSAYATLFSGFYNICMLLLTALVFRACAIEFRSQRPSKKWRFTWDMIFSIASLGIAFGIGFALGNLVQGVPLDEHHDLIREQFNPWQPYPILVGLTTAALFAMHGSIYLVMKTEGSLQTKLRNWTNRTIMLFILFYMMTTWATLVYMPHMTSRMKDMPYLFFFAMISMFVIASVPLQMSKGKSFRAFLSSSAGIAFLVAIYGIGTYPEIIHSSVNPATNSLMILNAASSELTLIVLLIIVAIGVPLVLAYSTCIYRVFMGKVRLGPTSY